MKKLSYLVIIAAAAMLMVSCGEKKNKAETPEVEAVETVATPEEEVVVEEGTEVVEGETAEAETPVKEEVKAE